MTKALDDIAAERKRQITMWGNEHDDNHSDESMAMAAACLASPDPLYTKQSNPKLPGSVMFRDPWPWPDDPRYSMPRTTADEKARVSRRRQLIKAAALIVAEIDRLDRQKEVTA